MSRYHADRDYHGNVDRNPSDSDNCFYYPVRLNRTYGGLQGLSQNYTLYDFDQHSVLEIHNFRGLSTSDLDECLECVVDTGQSLKYQFIGGGTLTIEGLSGYEDFTSLAMDYMVVLAKNTRD
jgi:hypothetical protein